MPARGRYFTLAIVAVIAGLIVHLHGLGLSATVRDVAGDALWAAMVFWLVSAVAPRSGLAVRGGTALLICVSVECSQLLHTPALDTFRATRVGHLLLGSGFDRRDLLAYAAGVAAAILISRPRGSASFGS